VADKTPAPIYSWAISGGVVVRAADDATADALADATVLKMQAYL